MQKNNKAIQKMINFDDIAKENFLKKHNSNWLILIHNSN